MPTQAFSAAEWSSIRDTLAAGPESFGFPERRDGSLLAGSFNIRKLGSLDTRDEETWEFLTEICVRFDVLAIQEIQDNLDGLRELLRRMGDEFDVVVSDKTGAFPGERGLGERLGFVYRRETIRQTEIATDISFDRTRVINTIADNCDPIRDALLPYADDRRSYFEAMEAFDRGERPRRPSAPKFKVRMPAFLTFIRTPYCASFETIASDDGEPYQFMAINAHLYYGNFVADRRQEFDALMHWILSRVEENDRAYYPNFLLLADLNLDFDNPKTDRARIDHHIKTFDQESDAAVTVNFPFLDPHPISNPFRQGEVFRTNARLTETYDQIGMFFRDARWPHSDINEVMGTDPLGPDYGMVDFVNLFSVALTGGPLQDLEKAESAALIARFEHRVSDHMPIWLRIPRP